MYYLIQKSHRFLAIVSPSKPCNVSIFDYSHINSIAGREYFSVSSGYGKDFPPMHGLKLVPFGEEGTHHRRHPGEIGNQGGDVIRRSDFVLQSEDHSPR